MATGSKGVEASAPCASWKLAFARRAGGGQGAAVGMQFGLRRHKPGRRLYHLSIEGIRAGSQELGQRTSGNKSLTSVLDTCMDIALVLC